VIRLLSSRPRRILGNSLLVLCSVLLTWLALEFLLIEPLLRVLPKSSFHYMIRELRVLGQTSFSGQLPEPGYVLITGDSFAQGKGDWFIDQGYDRGSRFHSAHVLQDLLGRDVVSMGRSGAGSFDGLVLMPRQITAMLKRLGRELPPPSVVLVYFYPGNDIQNNLNFLKRWIIPRFGEDTVRDPEALREALRRLAAKQATGRPVKWNDAPLVGNFILRIFRDTLRNTFTRKYIDVEPIVPAGEVNKALVAGEVTPLPDRIQSAPLELTTEQLHDGVAVLRESLALLAETFAPAPVILVYLPSPLGTYWLVGEEIISSYGGERPYPVQAQAERDAELFAAVCQAAASLDIPCLDPRPLIRDLAQDQLLHGPRDWDHFNKAGYHALARAVAEQLPSLPHASGE
jgi:hypothetical protein